MVEREGSKYRHACHISAQRSKDAHTAQQARHAKYQQKLLGAEARRRKAGVKREDLEEARGMGGEAGDMHVVLQRLHRQVGWRQALLGGWSVDFVWLLSRVLVA
jgi:hypothetical protein